MERILRQKLPEGKFKDVPPTRSKSMAAVRSKGNKTTERRLQMALVRTKLSGWILHPKGISGHPDFFFPQSQLAIFVDGCFWHGCPICGHFPRTNSEYWREKITRNQNRDLQTNVFLKLQGIKVLRIWEHELKAELPACVVMVKNALA